ncbi:MAG: phosphoribosylanthranilate isomerase [Aureispira sp.]|nr:phosphoribosylanthranilate isomerase [Aureispira sp.]
MFPKIKICCISSLQEAQLAIKAGASALGLVGPMPSGPGVIGDQLISQIAQATPPPIATFLLTSETSIVKIIAHHQRTNTNTIQLVDYLKEGSYEDLRAALPSVKLVQVIHVQDDSAIVQAQQIAPYVDAILLDSGIPNASTKILGGTGNTHNWAISAQLVKEVTKPVFLAGGIGPHNIREAIEIVQPFGIDLCSKVRTNGQLDPIKLKQLFKAAYS